MTMRLVMTLLLRDEEDIVEANLDHHLAQGVDFVIATDNGSVDGTVGILERYQRAGVLRLIHEPTDDYSQHAWVTRMARLASAEHGADWVINNDADEFWCPRTGPDLKATLEAVDPRWGAVAGHRFNFVPREPSDGPFREHMTVRHTRSVNEDGNPLPPKLAHRADPHVVVRQGNHEIESTGLGPVLDDGRIEILHFPLRSYAQFENKVMRGGAALARNTELPYEAGGRWRDWYRLWQEGRLAPEWARFAFTDEQVAAGLASGALVEDRRLADGPRSPAPAAGPR
jgi:hypothetical protein